jgi:hypothetical protein
MTMDQKKAARQYRQGDVFIIETTETPSAEHKEVPRDGGRVILAYGSATGHTHAIASPGAKLLRAQPGDDMFLLLELPAQLVHDEHDPIDLPAGTYLVRIQQQWDGATSREVED